MPLGVFKSIREVSSEDAVHCSENLIKPQSNKKWKTKTSTEASAYVILELEKECQIIGIDIGNEHSAFVEVLVGAAGCTPNQFTEILLTSSFMTPMESKTSSYPNRVRCFSKDALVDTAVDKKWKWVKIICTQPFNRHVQYGLSFIKIHIANEESPADKVAAADLVNLNKQEKKLSFGKFSFREESPDSNDSTELFKRWKSSKNDEELTAAQSIRKASENLRRLSESNCTQLSPKLQPQYQTHNTNKRKSVDESEIRDRNRDEIAFGGDIDNEVCDMPKQKRLQKHIEADRERLNKKTTQSKNQYAKQSPTEAAEKTNPAKAIQSDYIKPQKRRSSPTITPTKKAKIVDQTEYRPFNRLLSGVVLVISGIQNPDRADLRNKAIALGARYKADWEVGCTHLICAFKNTPKYNQVKGKGKIVTRSWIEKCFSLKKYLPWRRFALDSGEAQQVESDTEIFDESLRPKVKSSEKEDEHLAQEKGHLNQSSSIYDSELNDTQSRPHVASGSDTDDEIQRVVEQSKKASNNNKDGHDVYEISTEEEEYLKDKQKMEVDCNNLFENLKFYICSDVGAVDRIKLEKYVKQYSGQLTQCLSNSDIAVAEKKLDDNEAALKITGEIVRPLWVYECHDMEKRVPTTRYLVNYK